MDLGPTGRLEVTEEQLARLRQLSEAAGGWIAFVDAEAEVLVPLDEWKLRFEEWSQQ